jgi:hypothetical protein
MTVSLTRLRVRAWRYMPTMKASGRTSKVRNPSSGHAAGQSVPDGLAPRPGLPIRPQTL